MTMKLNVPQLTELKPRIVVVGVGGAGGNAVNNMIASGLEGVDFVVANTDAQSLALSRADRRIQLGVSITQGLGAGAKPDVGRQAAQEALQEIVDQIEGCHMAFITAGMGGGTGTGAAPVIAQAARERGILTVGVVTKPFHFEGTYRMKLAEQGIVELQQYVDTLIIIPNQNLFRIATEKTTFADAFKMADDVLHSGVRGVTDLMVMPGLINLDFADVRTVMAEMGKAMMGTGEANGEKRAIDAAAAAIANPLLDDIAIKGARGVLINITGGLDLTLFEVDEAANHIRKEVDPDANIIIGSTFDETMEGRMRVSVVATGIEAEMARQNPPANATSTMATGTNVRPLRPIEPRPQIAMRSSVAAAVAAVAVAPPREEPVTGPIATVVVPPVAVAAPAAVAEVAQPSMVAPVVAPPPVVEPVAQPVPEPRTAPNLTARREEPPPRVAQPTLTATERAGAPDPFRAAEMANASTARHPVAPAVEPRRGNLFRQMTQSILARSGKAPAPVAAPMAQPAPAAAPAPAPSQAAASLGKMGPDDRLTPPRSEEDLLEIPAFLRRQAN
jgi:cell division protein FtsZ